MSLTQEAIKSLKAKVEPREDGEMTETGLLKIHDGTLMTRPSTKYGFRSEEETTQAIENDAARQAELEALRAQEEQSEPKKKRGRKKAEPVAAAPVRQEAPRMRHVTVKLAGIGEIPSQYANVNIGENGVALVGVTPMSFIPKITDPSSDEPPTMFELSVNPGVKYVYLGNTVTLDNNVKQLVLYEVPEEEE